MIAFEILNGVNPNLKSSYSIRRNSIFFNTRMVSHQSIVLPFKTNREFEIVIDQYNNLKLLDMTKTDIPEAVFCG